MYLTISIISLILASLFDTIKDLSEEGKFSTKDNVFWNKDLSWINKWATHKDLYDGVPIESHFRLWYYLWLYKPKYKERFPFSSTVLVFLTDGWHLMKSLYIFINSIGLLSLSIGNTLDQVIVFACIYSVLFGILTEVWRAILIKK